MTETRVTIEQCDLDESLARMLLGMNTRNRPKKRDAINRYTDDIVNGRWRFTAEPVKVAEDGTLLDGQNRCYAVLQACERTGEALSIPILLVSDLDFEAQDHMDSGAQRSLGDQLARRGVSAYSSTAAMVRVLVMFSNGATSDYAKTNPTKAKMLLFFDANKDAIIAAHQACPEYTNTSGVHASVQAAARYLITQASPDQAAVEEFFHGLRVGADLPEGSPILALRTRTQYIKRDHEIVPNLAMLQLTLRAWNMFRRGESISMLPIRTRGKMLTVDKLEP